jgi:hypothetical protein
MIMNKLQKRLRKLDKTQANAVVIGTAFGNLKNILEIYNTVFVIDEHLPTVKAKNLVYKENFDNLNLMTEVGAIFFDLTRLNQFEMVKDLWQRNKSKVIIEGDEPIGREFSRPLYDTGWGCTSKQGLFHVWEKLK